MKNFKCLNCDKKAVIKLEKIDRLNDIKYARYMCMTCGGKFVKMQNIHSGKECIIRND